MISRSLCRLLIWLASRVELVLDGTRPIHNIVVSSKYRTHGLRRLESLEIFAMAAILINELLLRVRLSLHVSLNWRHSLRKVFLHRNVLVERDDALVHLFNLLRRQLRSNRGLAMRTLSRVACVATSRVLNDGHVFGFLAGRHRFDESWRRNKTALHLNGGWRAVRVRPLAQLQVLGRCLGRLLASVRTVRLSAPVVPLLL